MSYQSPALTSAIELLAWLIRTGRQPPVSAHRIAANKYRVDVSAVASGVGARGGNK